MTTSFSPHVEHLGITTSVIVARAPMIVSLTVAPMLNRVPSHGTVLSGFFLICSMCRVLHTELITVAQDMNRLIISE